MGNNIDNNKSNKQLIVNALRKKEITLIIYRKFHSRSSSHSNVQSGEILKLKKLIQYNKHYFNIKT